MQNIFSDSLVNSVILIVVSRKWQDVSALCWPYCKRWRIGLLQSDVENNNIRRPLVGQLSPASRRLGGPNHLLFNTNPCAAFAHDLNNFQINRCSAPIEFLMISILDQSVWDTSAQIQWLLAETKFFLFLSPCKCDKKWTSHCYLRTWIILRLDRGGIHALNNKE